MCDFCSFIQVGKGRSKKLLHLTDAIIEAKYGYGANYQQYIGHDTIRKHFGAEEVRGGIEKESFLQLPPEIAKAVNNGEMTKMYRAFFEQKNTRLKYSPAGKLIEVNGVNLAAYKKGTKGETPYPKELPEPFKIGEYAVIGRHFKEGRPAISTLEQAVKVLVAIPPEEIDTEVIHNWKPGMDAFVGKVGKVVFRSKGDGDSGGYKCIKIEGSDFYFNESACRRATPDEIEAGQAL